MRRQGFTLVEVMVALAVMTISAMGLFALQGQATRANGRARDITMATQIAQNIIERLKMDGLAWNTITPGDVTDLGSTVYLNAVDTATPGAFMPLLERTDSRGGISTPLSNAFNIFGDDVMTTGASAEQLASVKYCASIRLAWVYTTRRVMRADVRVFWSIEAPTRSIIADFPRCADDDVKLAPGGALEASYHTVYLSTVIRPHPL
ncbi:MAG TPA: prepilin-type N-terminal cleavage/methylation domain-containing protein [Polyangiales bacterium]|jgi:prepilin-type N-terminal cleavage/methylation domain-containing protein|nr:prepilin-type N-terminal cleavage/methylation domain-containing protein [Polyangiales bacterium]